MAKGASKLCADAQLDDGGVIGGEDAVQEKAPPDGFWRGLGGRGGGVVVSLP
jgi:hypothetical protein